MKADNLSVYLVVPGVNGRRHREDMLTGMESLFRKLTLISYMKNDPFHGHIKVNIPRNPISIFAKMGMPRIKIFFDKYWYFPSANMPRARSGEKVLVNNIQKDLDNGCDVCVLIYTPPHDFALLGYNLKKKFPNIRLLIDWQDLWSFDESYFEKISVIYRKRLLRIEQEIFKISDLNIVTNFKAAEVLENHYGVDRSKICSIPHPFDPEEREILSNLEHSNTHISNGVVKIGFLGGISKPPKVRGDKLLDTVDHLVDSGLPLELHIYGDHTDLTRTTVKKLNNSAQVVLHKRVNHLSSMKAISGCDFLLIALADLPNSHAIMHSKLPHYLILNRPILAFVPEKSFVAHVIEETGTGVVISGSANWERSLREIIESYVNGTFALERNQDAIDKYSWEQLSTKWIEAICGST